MKNKKTDKKKQDEKIQRIINKTVIIVLVIVGSVGYVHKEYMLQKNGVTVCKVINRSRKPGLRKFTGFEVGVEYYVKGVYYKSYVPNSSDDVHIGDCYKLRYSRKNPRLIKILWDEGKQPCPW